jgi:hypothetical protein
MTMLKIGSDVYISSAFDSEYTLIQKLSMSSGENEIFDFVGSARVKNAVNNPLDIPGSYSAGQIIAVQIDDSAPVRYNGTYIGSNHGAYIGAKVKSSSHGMGVINIGSQWSDSLGYRYTLNKVIDQNWLEFISDNIGSGESWVYVKPSIGGKMVRQDRTERVLVVESSETSQVLKSIGGRKIDLLVDGVKVINDGVYTASSVKFVESYRILNPERIAENARYGFGRQVKPEFEDSSYDVARVVSYDFAANGSCVISDHLEFLSSLNINYTGSVQAFPLPEVSGQIIQYVPGVRPVVVSGKAYDFAGGVPSSSINKEMHFTKSTWADPNNPPSRMMQISEAASVPEYGVTIGYSPAHHNGIPVRRSTLVNDAAFISANKKQYPKAYGEDGADGGFMRAGTFLDTIAFRSVWSAAVVPKARAYTWFKVGDDVVVVVDFGSAQTDVFLPVPESLNWKSVKEVQSDGVILETGRVRDGGFKVSSSGDRSSAVYLIR